MTHLKFIYGVRYSYIKFGNRSLAGFMQFWNNLITAVEFSLECGKDIEYIYIEADTRVCWQFMMKRYRFWARFRFRLQFDICGIVIIIVIFNLNVSIIIIVIITLHSSMAHL